MSLKKAKIKVQLFLVVLASLFFAFFICNTVFATSDPLTVTLSISSGFTDYSRIRVNGNITGSVGGNPRVTIYWGTTDGGRVPGNWQHSSAPTNPPQPQPISNFINDFYGLTSGVKYYFSASAENSAGISWPSAPLTFTDYYTDIAPNNAVSITSSTSTLKCAFTDDSVGHNITMYWGTTDGGKVPENWQHSSTQLTSGPSNSFLLDVSDLIPGTKYYFSASDRIDSDLTRSNTINILSEDIIWPTASLSFYTQLEKSNLGYIVKDAGSSDWNGFYWNNIAPDGHVMYTKDDTHIILFDSGWQLMPTTDTTFTPYYLCDIQNHTNCITSSTPPLTGWIIFRGNAPAPTLVAYNGGLNIALTNSAAVGSTTATLNGRVISTGGVNPTVTMYWGTTDGGQISENWEHSSVVSSPSQPQGIGNFSLNVSGLIPGRNYYFTAKATNVAETVWPSVSLGFKTNGPPTVTVSDATNTVGTTATLNGNVVSDGGSSTSVTIYWGKNDFGNDASKWENNFVLGNQTGLFEKNISGLTAGTRYHFTAKASNDIGTSWANQSLSFVAGVIPISLSTSAITQTTATVSGGFSDYFGSSNTVTVFWGSTDGGKNPINWDHSSYPTSPSIQPQEVVSFYKNFSGLTPGTKYYVTARAINDTGVIWATSSLNFTTLAATPFPIVYTTYVTNITSNSATINGSITNTGVDNSTVMIFWGTTNKGNTSVGWDSSSVVSDPYQPQGVGVFSKTINGLNPGTKYYFTARATNSAGISWPTASFFSFTTFSVPTVVISAATKVGKMVATINGNISNTGGENPTVTAYWGTIDGQKNSSGWQHSSVVSSPDQPQGVGAFLKNIMGLNHATKYYFTVKAHNKFGDSWPASSLNFTTLPGTFGCDPSINSCSNTCKDIFYLGDLWSDDFSYSYDNSCNDIYDWSLDTNISGDPLCDRLGISGTDGDCAWIFDYTTNSRFGCPSSERVARTIDIDDCSCKDLTTNLPCVVLPNYEEYFNLENKFFVGEDAPPAVSLNTTSDIAPNSAIINGKVTSTGKDKPTVTVYWGTSDGGKVPGNWQHSSVPTSPVQPQRMGNFNKFIPGLNTDTRYYYTVSATNSIGTAWSLTSANFTTLPSNITLFPATKIRSSSAVIKGNIAASDLTNLIVTVYWGTTNMWTNSNSWDYSAVVSQISTSGDFYQNITELETGETYYYFAKVTNAGGDVWAGGASKSFVAKTTYVSTPYIYLNSAQVGPTSYDEAQMNNPGGYVPPDWWCTNANGLVAKFDNSTGNLVDHYETGNRDGIGNNKGHAGGGGIALDELGNVHIADTCASTTGNNDFRYLSDESNIGIAIDIYGNIWSSYSNYVNYRLTSGIAKYSAAGMLIGSYPITGSGIAADANGNVWITNQPDGTGAGAHPSGGVVMKVNQSGTILGTYTVGAWPGAVAVDSLNNVWVVNNYDGTVTKLDGYTGNLIGTFGAGDRDTSGVFGKIAIDGSDNVYITNQSGIVKINGSTGSYMGHYYSYNPSAISIDDSENLWVVSLYGASYQYEGATYGYYIPYFVKINTSSGSIIKDFLFDGYGEADTISSGDFTGFQYQRFVLGDALPGEDIPPASTCDPANGACSSACKNLFTNNPGSDWSYWGGQCSDYMSNYVLADGNCDSVGVKGTSDGNCVANYWDSYFSQQLYCPSAKRLGRSVTTSDCTCWEPDWNINCGDYYGDPTSCSTISGCYWWSYWGYSGCGGVHTIPCVSHPDYNSYFNLKDDFFIDLQAKPNLLMDDATNIAPSTATLNGTLGSTGLDATITVFWGTEDGLKAAGKWQHSFIPDTPIQPQGIGKFSIDIGSLNPKTKYYFSARGKNTAGTTWAPYSASFTTPDYTHVEGCPSTGGTITSHNGRCINTFTSSGTFVPASGVSYAEVFVVAGGGGGGMDMGGGGGGGGVVYRQSIGLTPGTAVPVVVGAGGKGAPAAGTEGQPGSHQYSIPATNGGNSSFGNLTAIGGGHGGSSYQDYAPGAAGAAGGSGGGASGYTPSRSVAGGVGVSGQGYRGGNSNNSNYYSGGGGGAGGAGADGPNQPNGGPGILNNILGTDYYWGGGGGGASYTLSTGGNGGIGGGGGGAVGTTYGGAGYNNGNGGGGGSPNSQTNMPGGDAGANTGGGGGGGSHYNANNKGGNGGSGIVIVSYGASTPSVNLNVPTNMGLNAATLNGNIGSTGGENPIVTVYWGDNDGKKIVGNWDHKYTYSQPQGLGNFSKNISGLIPGTKYYFSASATNSIGTSWPTASLDFVASCSASGGDVKLVNISRTSTPNMRCVHAFNSNGVFTNTSAILKKVETLVVAGGGGGGCSGYWIGGGGGAGGLLHYDAHVLSSGIFNTYNVTIGAGGGGQSKGQNSVFDGIVAIGGGLGGATYSDGGSGGSGGGGGKDWNCGTAVGTPGQGNDGGHGTCGEDVGASGGGGAGGVGENAGYGEYGGNGGVGLYFPQFIDFGQSGYFAGGGGGYGSGHNGVGGYGGGGNMSVGGMANTGGGGGACAGGGSGVVLISYPQSAENVKTAPDISLSPATNVASDTATINGSISDTGGENPTVTVYWGDNDGGQTPGVWDHSYTYSQAQGAADFSKDITGLTSEKLYYFSAKASNSIGTTWASAYLTFTTTVAAPKITNIVVNEQGTIVAVSFDKVIDPQTLVKSQFTVKVGGVEYNIASASLDLVHPNIVNLALDSSSTIFEGQNVTVSYSKGSLAAAGASALINKGPHPWPAPSISIENNKQNFLIKEPITIVDNSICYYNDTHGIESPLCKDLVANHLEAEKNFVYDWDFGGGIDANGHNKIEKIISQNVLSFDPGPITFDTAGVHVITLTITDKTLPDVFGNFGNCSKTTNLSISIHNTAVPEWKEISPFQ